MSRVPAADKETAKAGFMTYSLVAQSRLLGCGNESWKSMPSNSRTTSFAPRRKVRVGTRNFDNNEGIPKHMCAGPPFRVRIRQPEVLDLANKRLNSHGCWSLPSSVHCSTYLSCQGRILFNTSVLAKFMSGVIHPIQMISKWSV